MSRELVLVFLYDCDMCKSEEDDPQEAIIYFYPTWVSGDQRHALCSQLMGVTQFCTNTFSSPAIISLQSGKFAISRNGRFALCVGTDSNIPELLLRRRLCILLDLLRFFHCNIECIDATISDDDDNLSDKFAQLLQTYLPIALDGANPFDSISLYKVPKSRVSVIHDAEEAIEGFRKFEGVLGGSVIYRNKIIFTQLSSSLTKLIILAHPYKVKLPAYEVSTPYHLPNGVQLLNVYVDVQEVAHLRRQTKNGACVDSDRLANDSEKLGGDEPKNGVKSDANLVENTDVPDLVLDAVRARKLARLTSSNSHNSSAKPLKKRMSKTTDDIISTTNIPMRYFSIGLPSVDSAWTDRKRIRHIKKEHFNTICDPEYPLFKPNGLPASCNFYANVTPTDSIERRTPDPSLKLTADQTTEKVDRQLSLALSKYSDRPPPKDEPLTPLMAKLSLSVASQELNIDASDPGKLESNGKLKTAEVKSKRDRQEDSGVVRLVLFVTGFEESAVVLLLEEAAVEKISSIQLLWSHSSYCLKNLVEKLGDLPEGDDVEISSAGEYSYAVVDPEWGPAERGGFHRPRQLEALTVLHDTLRSKPHVSEILVREEDSVTYGYRCGLSRVFYQQNCTNNSGVPTSADLMAVIPLKATSVLSRDHNVIKI